ncbi:MAG: hypothetical protein MK165_06545 [Pirellulaceae bacterium]|nr:hypothetical protein [Pirellulaceae bacterium]
MNPRRNFLKQGLATSLAGWSLSSGLADEATSLGELHLAPFRFDVTPPTGHPCCGGLTKPVEAVDDSLEAIGIVLWGLGKPIVICAVDWTGILNDAHVQWRTVLADAAGTTPDRVAVQCVHQHNAPFACLDAQQIVEEQGDLPPIVEVDFFHRCLDRARTTIQAAVRSPRRITHIAQGQGKVEKVASNRRVSRDSNGQILRMRGSSCQDEELIALPEGLIDPWLKTVVFFDGAEKIAACHYYATHPMSYYGDGRVSSDFAGLARKLQQAADPTCTYIYFTGCAGNVAAGKYNNGSKPVRPLLTKRLHQGILKSLAGLQPEAIHSGGWKTVNLLPPKRESFVFDQLAQQIADPDQSSIHRNRCAYRLAWMQRLEQQVPIVLSSLHINGVRLLHLPAECFVQYQLRAQRMQQDQFVAAAAYGDGGPWYIPIKEEYPAGGYEVSVAFCHHEVDALLTAGIEQLLA